MPMSRKDYELIAGALREAIDRTGGPESYIDIAVYLVADALLKDNPRFDRERFVAACIPSWCEED